jgi:hypothetical protein
MGLFSTLFGPITHFKVFKKKKQKTPPVRGEFNIFIPCLSACAMGIGGSYTEIGA